MFVVQVNSIRCRISYIYLERKEEYDREVNWEYTHGKNKISLSK